MEKIKHNHNLTDILKVCLFSLLMLAPLLASISQMLYVTLNKNAKDSYYGETINQEQFITPTQFNSNQEYHLYMPSSTEFVRQASATDMTVTNVTLNGTTYNINTLRFYVNANTTVLVIQGYNIPSNNDSFIISSSASNNYEIVFTYLSQNNTNYTEQILPLTKYIEYNKYSYLDNAFYYGVDQMTKSDLFNWTQNTGIYTGVQAMTNGIGIESIFIPMLLTYWLVLTIVYIIIDVVIETFKYLTHMLQNKVKSKTS